MISKKLALRQVRLGFFVFVGLLLTSFPATARADAIYSASSSASITIIGFRDSSGSALAVPPSALIILSQITFAIPDSTSSGNASASTTGNATASSGNLSITSSVSGQAGGPAGSATSSFQTGGIVTIVNSSTTEGFFVDYMVSLQYSLSASVDLIGGEIANAGLVLNIVSPDDILVSFSDIVVPGVRNNTFTTTFSLFIPASGGTGFGTGFGMGGHAETPEPAAMFLFGTGLAGVALKIRKRLRSNKTRQGSDS